MVKKILMIILVSLIVALFFYNNNAAAESCDDIYIVQPPNNEGGTFYLSLQRNPKTHQFSRAGYIPTMTLVKIDKKEDGFPEEKWISEKKHGPQHPYFKFIGTDGSAGYIKRISITPLGSMFKYKNQLLNCNSPHKLVIPISPVEEVILYDKPENNSVAPRQIGKFSRSVPDIVFTDEALDYWDSEDHREKIPFYKVRFSQKKKEGDFKERDALVKAEGENRVYRLLPIDPGKYQHVASLTKEALLSKIKCFFRGLLKDYESKQFVTALGKSCAREYSMEATIKVGAELPLKFIRVEGDVAGKVKIEYPIGYRYCLDCYNGFISKTKSYVFKTVRCENNSTTDWFTEHLTIREIGKNKEEFEIFQHQLERRFKEYIDKPDTTGIAGIKREKMVALKKFEEGSGKDYFTAFSKLSEYLDERFFNKVDLDTVEKLQFKSLVMRLIVDCE